MLNKIKNILHSIPEQEIKNFYCYFYHKCEMNINKEDLEAHILQHLRMYLKAHKIWLLKGDDEKAERNIIKSMIIFNWLTYMENKYLKRG